MFHTFSLLFPRCFSVVYLAYFQRLFDTSHASSSVDRYYVQMLPLENNLQVFYKGLLDLYLIRLTIYQFELPHLYTSFRQTIYRIHEQRKRARPHGLTLWMSKSLMKMTHRISALACFLVPHVLLYTHQYWKLHPLELSTHRTY